MAASNEQIEYGETTVPVIRQNIAEFYIALKPPDADPYMVVPLAAEAQDIVDFFAERVQTVEQLRPKMRKRYTKNKSDKCQYRTGDIAYLMGRPFMLQVNRLGDKPNTTKGTRGRVTVKYSVNTELSLITLFVVKPKDYDQTKTAFMSYATAVILKNAPGMAASCVRQIMPGYQAPQVRMRSMRNKWSYLDETSTIWLSDELVPYPIDCLVHAVWSAVLPYATIDADEARQLYEQAIPGWQHAQQLLADRPKPYSNQ